MNRLACKYGFLGYTERKCHLKQEDGFIHWVQVTEKMIQHTKQKRLNKVLLTTKGLLQNNKVLERTEYNKRIAKKQQVLVTKRRNKDKAK